MVLILCDVSFPRNQYQLAILFIDAAMDEDGDVGGKLGGGFNSPMYYKKARKLLKKAAEQV